MNHVEWNYDQHHVKSFGQRTRSTQKFGRPYREPGANKEEETEHDRN